MFQAGCEAVVVFLMRKLSVDEVRITRAEFDDLIGKATVESERDPNSDALVIRVRK